MDRKQKKVIKLGVVGNSGAGKTTLIYRIANNKFFVTPMAGVTIDFEKIKDYKSCEQTMDLHIFDIAGLGKNNDLVISFIKDAQALLLVFDLAEIFGKNTSLLNSIQSDETNQHEEQFSLWYDKIIERGKLDVPVLVVGTKSDKVDLSYNQILDKIDKILHDLQAKKPINLIKSEFHNFHIISSFNGNGVPCLVDLWVKNALVSEQKQTSFILKPESKVNEQKCKKKGCC